LDCEGANATARKRLLSSTVKQKGSQVNPQKTARVAGVLFVITFITAILAALILYGPVLDDPRYIVGAGAGTRVFWGALLELILVIANIGTVVVLSRWSNLRIKTLNRTQSLTCGFPSHTVSALRLVVPTGSERSRSFLVGARVSCGVNRCSFASLLAVRN
jgi:Domain of unknown function (DUF4386)